MIGKRKNPLNPSATPLVNGYFFLVEPFFVGPFGTELSG